MDFPKLQKIIFLLISCAHGHFCKSRASLAYVNMSQYRRCVYIFLKLSYVITEEVEISYFFINARKYLTALIPYNLVPRAFARFRTRASEPRKGPGCEVVYHKPYYYYKPLLL
jgi:hypothetical protein